MTARSSWKPSAPATTPTLTFPAPSTSPRHTWTGSPPTLLPDRQARIVVYCTGTGTSSDAVARRLEELGYTAVAVYAGGKEDWVEHGLPVERLNTDG